MKITETNVTGLTHSFQIIVSAEEVNQLVDVRLNKIGKTVQIPGFRKGKVPLQMLRQRYGQSALDEAVEEKVGFSVQKALIDGKIRPALKPKVNLEHFKEGEDLTINFSVEALPTVENLNIDGFSLERLNVVASEEEFNKNIEKLKETRKVPVALKKNRPIKEGDVIYLSYKIILDQKEIDQKQGEGASYEVGSNFFGDEFDSSLRGLEIGYTGTREFTLPAPNFGKDAGKKAHITFTIKNIMVLETPDLEALSKSNGFKDVEEFKAALYASIASHYDSYTRQNMKQQILDLLSQKYQFEIPQGLVDLEFDAIWQEYENFEKKEEAKEEKPLSQKDKEDLQKEYRDIAERRVRLGLLLAEIGIQNGIRVTNQDLGEALYDHSMNYPEQQGEIINFYKSNPDAMTAFQAPIFEKKVIDYIIQKSKLTDREVSIDELMKIIDENEETSDGSESSDQKKSVGKSSKASSQKVKKSS